MQPKKQISERYTQVKQMMGNRTMVIQDIIREMQISENYARRMINDLVFSGHIAENKIRLPNNRQKALYRWQDGKEAPSEYTRSFSPAVNVKFKRTDPLMIALYGE